MYNSSAQKRKINHPKRELHSGQNIFIFRPVFHLFSAGIQPSFQLLVFIIVALAQLSSVPSSQEIQINNNITQ
ncbi:hypothetical protein POREN0001_1948 [Porphyromonas endodontalis ATCC 35406]|uniref:Uncharacterized protein n=1 Tax=Porphyromonas endodontalis (strain ATCC 35406 / DSM 24491 / JCM 8526 / CCUG 16442 / BCRC 14492 / NCTC 13058 / HG 370) TaxID=553175 RepID=C3JCS9_POREA|nr:hypothetical protein POREN0001_1948 [Porphyromonas endodontalis ATCC 35406]SUB76499.1 Uncharacterised protein [Porphyromonas endodontalis]